MTYRVMVTRAAAKAIRRLDTQVQQRVTAAIKGLETAPRPHGYKPVIGTHTFRIRVGEYRVLYSIDDDVLLLVEVVHAGHRSDVYR